jgi:hypothetical protein
MSFEEAAATAIAAFIQHWGWTVLLLLITVYFASPYIKAYLEKESLKDARNPTREKVLKDDMKKARIRQQLDFYKFKREQMEGV